jgi:hypothetical protein
VPNKSWEGLGPALPVLVLLPLILALLRLRKLDTVRRVALADFWCELRDGDSAGFVVEEIGEFEVGVRWWWKVWR